MKKIRRFEIDLMVVFILCLGIIGCDGGSDSSNDIFAKPTLKNALEVKKQAIINRHELAFRGRSLINVDKNSSDNVEISENKECPLGGFMSIGSEHKVDEVTITFTFEQCDEGIRVIDGSMYITFSNYDLELNDYKNNTIKFTSDVTIKSGIDQEIETVHADSYMTVSMNSSTKYELLIDMKVTGGEEKYSCKNCIFHYDIGSSKVKMYQKQGRVYIDGLSTYVEYDTSYDMSKTPFVFNSNNSTPKSGEIRYTMANGGKMKVVVEERPIVYIDEDGDGDFELSDKIDVEEDNNISKKKYIIIYKHMPSGVCEGDYFEYQMVKSGLVNPIFEEKDNSITCADYSKKDDGNECIVWEYKNPDSNIAVKCVIGYDYYQSQN